MTSIKYLKICLGSRLHNMTQKIKSGLKSIILSEEDFRKKKQWRKKFLTNVSGINFSKN